ncbi:hypothetical protein [Catalinimonas niigatensis]|uniref:hypothetical protein n=1 Tax=Catalinimonas niigatensis TaxID=1397264 RepID=UPI002666E51F|nr:hypothetical protein [Catalinimonas niigatensis]WPP52771.1 hypothetical protein PZB72_10320 [Catalinimonas niigatensis]
MIAQIRHSLFTKILWGVMGLYLLNISVDTEDPNPQHIPEDLSFNDQESIVEIIVEKLLGFENAIEEYDDLDTEEQEQKNNIKIDLLVCSRPDTQLAQSAYTIKDQQFPEVEAHLTSGFQQINTPPPKS